MMMTMKWISVGFAVAGAVMGLFAAGYWYRSSKVPIQPSWLIEPGDVQLSEMGWMAGMMNAFTTTAKLNSTAALLTAVSVVFSAASIFIGIWAGP